MSKQPEEKKIMIDIKLQGIALPGYIPGMELSLEQKKQVVLMMVDRLRDTLDQAITQDARLLEMKPLELIQQGLTNLGQMFIEYMEKKKKDPGKEP